MADKNEQNSHLRHHFCKLKLQVHWNTEFKLGTLLSIKLLRAEVGYKVNDATKRLPVNKAKCSSLPLYLLHSISPLHCHQVGWTSIEGSLLSPHNSILETIVAVLANPSPIYSRTSSVDISQTMNDPLDPS